MSWAKAVAGKQARFSGLSFERSFQPNCAMTGVACVRIPDSCMQTAQKIVRVPSPFDFVLAFEGKSAAVDLKSIKEGNFTHSKITPHQLRALKELSCGMITGYVVGFENEVFFISISLLLSLEVGSSIDLTRALYLGKRVQYDVRLIFKGDGGIK